MCIANCKYDDIQREKEQVVTQFYDEKPYINRKFNNQLTTQKVTKNFDYTTIADRLRTVSWSNNSNQTGVAKPGLKGTNLPTQHKNSVIYQSKEYFSEEVCCNN